MFKRLKDWIFNRPAKDHIVAGFAWLGGACLALGSMVAVPALAPLACGAMVVATEMAAVECCFSAAHLTNDFFSWIGRKIFKRNAQLAEQKNDSSAENSEKQKSQEKEKQPKKQAEKASEEPTKEPVKGPEEAAKEPGKAPEQPVPQTPALPPRTPATPAQIPTDTPKMPLPDAPQQGIPAKESTPKEPQMIQISAEQFLILIQELKALREELTHIRRENAILLAANQYFKQSQTNQQDVQFNNVSSVRKRRPFVQRPVNQR